MKTIHDPAPGGDKTAISVAEVYGIATHRVAYNLNLIDAEIRRQLIAMGWTPPRELGDESSQQQQALKAEAAQPRTDAEIVTQTEAISALLASAFHGSVLCEGLAYRDSHNPKAKQCWKVACDIQEVLTATDVENAAAELDEDQAAQPNGAKLKLTREE